MKNLLVFLFGIFSGIALTIATLYIIASVYQIKDNGMTFFEQPGECMSTNPFEVMQVIDDNYALAHEMKWNKHSKNYLQGDMLVLITNDNNEYYYDDQLIKIPKGQCARQIGIYKYHANSGMEKTVPIVKIMK